MSNKFIVNKSYGGEACQRCGQEMLRTEDVQCCGVCKRCKRSELGGHFEDCNYPEGDWARPLALSSFVHCTMLRVHELCSALLSAPATHEHDWLLGDLEMAMVRLGLLMGRVDGLTSSLRAVVESDAQAAAEGFREIDAREALGNVQRLGIMLSVVVAITDVDEDTEVAPLGVQLDRLAPPCGHADCVTCTPNAKGTN